MRESFDRNSDASAVSSNRFALLHRSLSISFFSLPNPFRSMSNSGGGSLKANNMGMSNFDQQEQYNTYGLSPSFLASLRIQGPLHNKIFVANVSMKFIKPNTIHIFCPLSFLWAAVCPPGPLITYHLSPRTKHDLPPFRDRVPVEFPSAFPTFLDMVDHSPPHFIFRKKSLSDEKPALIS